MACQTAHILHCIACIATSLHCISSIRVNWMNVQKQQQTNRLINRQCIFRYIHLKNPYVPCAHMEVKLFISLLSLSSEEGDNVKIALKWVQRICGLWTGSTGRNVDMVRISWILVCLLLYLLFSAAQSVYRLSLSCQQVCCSAGHTVYCCICSSLLHSVQSVSVLLQCRTQCLLLCLSLSAAQSVYCLSLSCTVLHHNFPMIHCTHTHTSLSKGRSALGHALNATPCNTHIS
jgi:hypothetical protein